MPDVPTVYAIDFGTSNSLLAAASGERVFDPIPLDLAAPDRTILRSILCFPDAGGAYVGAEALRQFVEHGSEARLLRSIKHHLGSRSFRGTVIRGRMITPEALVAVVLAMSVLWWLPAVGTPVLHYQWQAGGVPLNGKNGAALSGQTTRSVPPPTTAWREAARGPDETDPPPAGASLRFDGGDSHESHRPWSARDARIRGPRSAGADRHPPTPAASERGRGRADGGAPRP